MSNKAIKTKMFVTRQVHTYAEIIHVARSLLMMGQDKKDGSFFPIHVKFSFYCFFLIKLFKFRNSLAHGKSEILNQEEIVPSSNVYDYIFYNPQTTWENYCNQENASRAIEDAERIIIEIHDKANIDDEIPFSGGHTSTTFS